MGRDQANQWAVVLFSSPHPRLLRVSPFLLVRVSSFIGVVRVSPFLLDFDLLADVDQKHWGGLPSPSAFASSK